MKLISVVIPTIDGREHHFARCLGAYELLGGELEIIEVRNEPTCGAAWRKGGEKAKGDYIHFTADDLEPHAGWWEAATRVADEGKIPCPRILHPSGALESCGAWGVEVPDGTETTIARVPFLTREMWERGGWVLDAHYYTDNFIWWRGQQLGIPTVVCRDYLFTHYYASEGRKHTIDADRRIYEATTR